MALNKVMLIGNVGKEPEIRYINNNAGAKVASFTLATTERYRDASGEMKETTEWHNIVAWRNSADVVEKYVHKGTQLYIEGKLRTRSWDDKTGVKRYTTEIQVDSLQLLGRKADNDANAAGPVQNTGYSQKPVAYTQAPQAAPIQTAAPVNFNEAEDDLPF